MFQHRLEWLARAIPLVLLVPFFSGCVTSQSHQRALDEKDNTIRELRDERAQLKAQLQGLAASRDDALGQLAEAGSRPESAASEPAAPVAAATFPELDSVGVSYGVRDGHMVLSIPASITFASGKAELSDDGRKALKKVASTLQREYPEAHFSVEGHTDADPIKKSGFASNRDLSVARAMAVLRFLVEDCGVADDRCIVAGHGQYDPVASNKKDADKAKNRRVEIVVLGTASAPRSSSHRAHE
ncbi:MAG: OmpA family protein [Planctomycetota bacterium]|nr:OmpA family protein [Planctomycetota bacterium]